VLCTSCRELYAPDREQLVELGVNPEDPYALPPAPRSQLYQQAARKLQPTQPLVPGQVMLYRAVGCDECLGTGYLGRTGVYEMVMITDEIRTNILRNADSNTIKRVAKQDGMISLREDGARKVLAGVTTIEEVLRVTHEDAG